MPQIVARCKIYTFLQNQGETPTCLNQTGGSFLLDFEGRSPTPIAFCNPRFGAVKPRFGTEPFGLEIYITLCNPRCGSVRLGIGAESFGLDIYITVCNPRFGSVNPRFGTEPFGLDIYITFCNPRFGSVNPRFGTEPAAARLDWQKVLFGAILGSLPR